jgi:hypothetical protein
MSLFFPGDVHFLGLGGLLGQGTTAASRLLLHILPFGFFTLAIAHHFSIRLWELFTHWIMSLIFPSLEIFCAEHKAEQVPERSEGMRARFRKQDACRLPSLALHLSVRRFHGRSQPLFLFSAGGGHATVASSSLCLAARSWRTQTETWWPHWIMSVLEMFCAKQVPERSEGMG